MPITISDSKAIEIIITFSDRSDYFFSKVEKYLLDNKIIDDCINYSDYVQVLTDLKPKMLESILELI